MPVEGVASKQNRLCAAKLRGRNKVSQRHRPFAVGLRLPRDNRHDGIAASMLLGVRPALIAARVFQAVPVRRYHFHIRCGDRVLFDGTGRVLPGLTEAAREAERIARTLMHRDHSIIANSDGCHRLQRYRR